MRDILCTINAATANGQHTQCTTLKLLPLTLMPTDGDLNEMMARLSHVMAMISLYFGDKAIQGG